MANALRQRLRILGIGTAGVLTLCMGLVAYEYQNNLVRMVVSPAMRLLPVEIGNKLMLLACKYRLYADAQNPDDANLQSALFGRYISNPIGIAAGFDRNGEAVSGLRDVGFGFVEIGSVTPSAQKSGLRTRIFRLAEDRAVVNRSIVDSDGHQAVAQRLRQLRNTKEFDGVVGVNLERNRTSKTPINDYILGIRTFGSVADYLVVNYSLPKEPYGNKRNLIQLLTALNIARIHLRTERKIPILLKLSPDMTLSEMRDVADVIKINSCRVDGLVVSNATLAPRNLNKYNLSEKTDALGGEPLRNRSTRMIAQMYDLTNGSIPIIGVGGVSSGQDAYEKIEAGASYIQIYTAFLLEGPELVQRIKQELSSQVANMGFNNVREVIGSNYQFYLTSKKQNAPTSSIPFK